MMKQEQARITQVLNGETDAYRYLIERYQTGLIIHCENIVKDRQEAEDIAQETFIKAYRELAKFKDGQARFSTWIYKIATNLCLDSLRKSRRKVDVANIESHMEVNIPRYMEEEENAYLCQVVESLEPPQYAEIIKAYFWEGKSYQTLAEQYQTTTGTIGSWLTRAKAQLREKLS